MAYLIATHATRRRVIWEVTPDTSDAETCKQRYESSCLASEWTFEVSDTADGAVIASSPGDDQQSFQ